MNDRRCGVYTEGYWWVTISGDAVDLDPDNVAFVREGDPFGMPCKVWAVRVMWDVNSRGLVPWEPGMSWTWKETPEVELDLGYVDVTDGRYTDPDPDGPGLPAVRVDWSSRTAPAWVRRLVEERVTGPTGERATLPPPPDPPAVACEHDDCPVHGGAK